MAEIGANFLANLSDRDLIIETRAAIKTEREATSVVVRYFREINERELFLKHACSSLFQFATEKLGYCAASAQARINAMQLIEAVPQVEEKIESGELSLTAAAKVQTFFRAERKENKSYSIEQKLKVINECLSKSTREVEQELAKRNPEVAKIEYVKPVGKDRFQISFSISEETEEKMKHLKGLFAHSNPNMSIEELFEKLIELGLDKHDPLRKAKRFERLQQKKAALRAHEVEPERSKSKADLEAEQIEKLGTAEVSETVEVSETAVAALDTKVESNISDYLDRGVTPPTSGKTSATKLTRYIPAQTKHNVWLRNANLGCEHVSDEGQRCSETRALQIDHIYGYARGGSHEVQNLRVLCAKHNRSEWSRKRAASTR